MGSFKDLVNASVDPIGHLTGSTKANEATEKAAQQAAAGYRDFGDAQGTAYDEYGPAQAEAYTGGADILADSQNQALGYLQDAGGTGVQGKTGAQQQLMGLYGLEGGKGNQQQFINQAKQSPLYSAITGTRQAGEDAIMRNAAATGGLRSGGVNANMYDFNQRLNERALLEAYGDRLGGLQDISGWQTNENNIADAMVAPGQTQAKGYTAGGLAESQAALDGSTARNQANLDAETAMVNSLTAQGQATADGRGEALKTAGTIAAAVWSDRRLKGNVKLVTALDGVNVYEWTWNKLANGLGLFGGDLGVMANEIQKSHPDAVGEREGFLTVNYGMLGV